MLLIPNWVYRETIPFGSVVMCSFATDIGVISNEAEVYDRFTERHVWNYDAPNSAYSFVAEMTFLLRNRHSVFV